MKSFLMALLGLLVINTTGLAELLENGDFSEGIHHWFLGRNADYGVETAAQVKDGALQLSKLTGPNPRYMGLSQPVDISEGTTYRVSFEYQASPGAKFSVALGDPKIPAMTSKRIKVTSSDWESATYELTAKVSTDSSWLKNAKKEAATTKLIKGQTPRTKKKKTSSLKPGSCQLRFGLGGIEGTFAVRNISLVEIQ